MSTTRGAGWWLPEPRSRFDAPSNPNRTRLFRQIGAWTVRLWLLVCVGFGGLLWSAPKLTTGQAFFGTLVFTGGTGLVLMVVFLAVWYAP